MATAGPKEAPVSDLRSAQAQADVTAVTTSGRPGSYDFHVTVRSPDTGCSQYADWWEVVSNDGRLVYRRTLLHSHPVEQPFTRPGGPVEIAADEPVIVRGHMSTGGYGGEALEGSASGGFREAQLPEAFAADLESADPQPPPCAF